LNNHQAVEEASAASGGAGGLTMGKPKHAARPMTAWEANCLFCGEGLADEGEAFYRHMGSHPGCHDAFEHWIEEIAHDHPGG
jgi:hypothetical protein